MQVRRKAASDSWRRATEALAKNHFDYAVKLLGQAVQLVPDSLVYRQHLRGAEKKMYKDNGSGAMLSAVRTAGCWGKIKKARMQSNWADVDRFAEEGLAVNPWDAALNCELGEACLNLGYDEIAQFSFESAVEASKRKNAKYLEWLATAYERRGNYDQAVACFVDCQKIDPLNGHYRSMISGLAASKAIRHGKYDEAKSTHEINEHHLQGQQPQPQLGYEESVKGKVVEQKGPAEEMSLEVQLEREIRKSPTEKGLYLKLAEFYRKELRFAESIKTLEQAFQLTGGDPTVRELIEDTQLDLQRHNLDLAKGRLGKDPHNEQTKRNVESITNELREQEIEVFSRRSERYPKDMRLRVELAQRLMLAKRFPQAIEHLQRAVTDPRLEVPVLVNLGKCFLGLSQKGLALKQFERASAKIEFEQHPDFFKECHYMLGRLYEEARQLDRAENHYSEVIAHDFSYKDAHHRLQKIQSASTDQA